ncbi:MAG: hypothetical protein HKO60_01685, partial [Pseudomonadales bacterium]|nr:hypothetical protein [Pseudomonadales bacterium]
ASPTYIPAGGRLQISNRGAAGCSYLAIAGGIDCPEVLGSRATDLNAGFGGIEGHMLGSAEKIQPYPLAPKQKHFLPLECQISARFSLREASPDNVIAILPGPGYAAVQNDLTQIICAKPFIMGADSDRMGARFKCANTRATAALARGDKAGLMASHGVARGAMQLLPDGGLIVLLADAQTTGGYPCIANVIEADLYKLAQLPPGDSVQFIQVNFAQARSASVKQSAALQRAKYSMQQYMRKQSPNHE